MGSRRCGCAGSAIDPRRSDKQVQEAVLIDIGNSGDRSAELVVTLATDRRLLTEEQIGGVVIVPVIALVLLQATGTLLVGAVGYTLLAIIVLVISFIGLRIGVRLFDREAILTRWR